MFYKHFIANNDEDLYLFIDNNFEFSKEFKDKNIVEKSESLLSKIRDYLNDKKIKFNGKKIFLVSSGIVIGTLYLSNAIPKALNINDTPRAQYAISLEDFNKVEVPKNNNIEINIEDDKLVPEDNTDVRTNAPTTNKPTNTQKNTTNTQKNNTTVNNTTANTNNTTQPSTPKIEETKTAEKIYENPVTVYRANGNVEVMELEEFIVGVVSAEMPASFNAEALKTQAVASRTYYLKAIDMNKKVTEINSGQQTYKDINQLKSLWGNSFDTYYNKVKNAVQSTKGEYITYNGDYIEAVYSSTNNGYTESSLEVWGNYYPYLISVESPWDVNASSYLRTVTMDLSVVNSLLGLNLDDLSEIEVLSKTEGSRVDEMKIDGSTFSGLYLRSTLGLRSTDFDIDIDGSKVSITTRGYGHGVGMSQYGSNGMANDGYNYRQIINHYYPNTTIEKM